MKRNKNARNDIHPEPSRNEKHIARMRNTKRG
jgi:hypothetical protein